MTDLYELTMAQSYFEHQTLQPATFSLFVRRLPQARGFLAGAGLEDALDFLEGVAFSKDDISYLHSTNIFSGDFLDFLRDMRFSGEVWAIEEGRIFFANEPLLEVTAPLIEAQIVETYLINQLTLQSLIASKAARCVVAAGGRSLVDFALRRTQGTDAGLKVARSSYLAGFDATSDVLAGKRYGIPISGTMAHSFVTAYEHEIDAFRAFAASFPDRSVLLIDTYDTIDGARKAVLVAREMESKGRRLQGVRLDSGDLLSLSKEVRRIFDEAGLPYVQIVASGGLDEYEIDELLRKGAPIDSFGVGTKMGVSADAPWLDTAYKMVSLGQRPVLKLSSGKISLPGAKQVYRRRDAEGQLKEDVLALRGEALDGAAPLLVKVMDQGKRLLPSPPLEEIRRRFGAELERLPAPYKSLAEAPPAYPVRLSEGLTRLSQELSEQAKSLSARELGES